LRNSKKEALMLTCTEEPRDKKIVEQILIDGKNKPWYVKEVKESEQKTFSTCPFYYFYFATSSK
jgi:hypothetical protein